MGLSAERMKHGNARIFDQPTPYKWLGCMKFFKDLQDALDIAVVRSMHPTINYQRNLSN